MTNLYDNPEPGGITYVASAPRPDAHPDLLTTRAATHGDYSDVASVAQNLKYVVHAAPNWNQLNVVQKETVEMICSKMARYLCGDPNFPDHMLDIAGYATLDVERCRS